MAVISQHFIIIFNKNVLKNLKLVVSLVIRKNIYKMNNHSESFESIVVIYLKKTCLIRIKCYAQYNLCPKNICKQKAEPYNFYKL